MQYTPQHVANYFLKRAEDEGCGLDQLKLMKLVYIAYGWVLALTGRRLFQEPIQAWQHGPVIRSIYDEFKHFRRKAIEGRAEEYDLDDWTTTVPEVPADDTETRMILGKVWAAYRQFTGWQLRQKTHEPNTPWSMVYSPDRRDQVIPDELIRPHFLTVIRRILGAVTNRSAAA